MSAGSAAEAGPKGPAYKNVIPCEINVITVGGSFRARHQTVEGKQLDPVNLAVWNGDGPKSEIRNPKSEICFGTGNIEKICRENRWSE